MLRARPCFPQAAQGAAAEVDANLLNVTPIGLQPSLLDGGASPRVGAIDAGTFARDSDQRDPLDMGETGGRSARARLPALDADHAYDLGPDTVLAIRRGECFGPCPAYSIGVTADGTVHYYGEMYTDAAGYRTRSMGVTTVRTLLAFLKARSFVALKDDYPAMGTDHSRVTLVLRQGGRAKRVVHDTSNPATKQLLEIESEIDRALRASDWNGRAPASFGNRVHGRATPAPIRSLARKSISEAELACRRSSPQRTRLSIHIETNDVGGIEPGSLTIHGDLPTANEACIEERLRQVALPLIDTPGLGVLDLEL